jgi:hypothetical protein
VDGGKAFIELRNGLLRETMPEPWLPCIASVGNPARVSCRAPRSRIQPERARPSIRKAALSASHLNTTGSAGDWLFSCIALEGQTDDVLSGAFGSTLGSFRDFLGSPKVRINIRVLGHR